MLSAYCWLLNLPVFFTASPWPSKKRRLVSPGCAEQHARAEHFPKGRIDPGGDMFFHPEVTKIDEIVEGKTLIYNMLFTIKTMWNMWILENILW